MFSVVFPHYYGEAEYLAQAGVGERFTDLRTTEQPSKAQRFTAEEVQRLSPLLLKLVETNQIVSFAIEKAAYN